VSADATAYQSRLASAGYTVANVQSGATASAAGTTFSAKSSKWAIQVAAGSSPSSIANGGLKNGEFALNVTVNPASGSTSP
jgi:hypothetical protein